MLKKTVMTTLVLVFASGQVCNINVNPVTGTPLRDADATIVIERKAASNRANVEAEITRGFSGVVLEDDQNVKVNGDELQGSRGNYVALVDAADIYLIAVTDPRRGTDTTEIAEPPPFEISTPLENEVASLSGFSIEWTEPDAELDVEVVLTQSLLGDDLLLKVGPTVDDGEVEIKSSALADAGFGQGEPLTITVTKIRRAEGIAGFDDGTAECRLAVSIDVNPGP